MINVIKASSPLTSQLDGVQFQGNLQTREKKILKCVNIYAPVFLHRSSREPLKLIIRLLQDLSYLTPHTDPFSISSNLSTQSEVPHLSPWSSPLPYVSHPTLPLKHISHILLQGLSWTHLPYYHPQYPSTFNTSTIPNLPHPVSSHLFYNAPTFLHPERYATSFSRVQPSPFQDAFNLSIQPKLPHPSSGSSPVSSASHLTVSPPTSLTSCCEIYPSQFSIPSPSSFFPKCQIYPQSYIQCPGLVWCSLPALQSLLLDPSIPILQPQMPPPTHQTFPPRQISTHNPSVDQEAYPIHKSSLHCLPDFIPHKPLTASRPNLTTQSLFCQKLFHPYRNYN